MQQGATLDLPYLTMDEDAFAMDPFPHFATARAQHPWLARWTLGYVVTDYQAMRDLFAMEAKMGMLYDNIVEIMEAKGTRWGNFQQRHMLNQTGAAHKHIRDVLASSFTPRQANLHRPLMQQVIAELLDEWAPRRAFDFEEFASFFPITVMCRLIGADPSVIPGLRSAMEAIGLSTSMDKRWLPAMQQGVVTMEEFVDGLIADRRAGKRASDEHGFARSAAGNAERGRADRPRIGRHPHLPVRRRLRHVQEHADADHVAAARPARSLPALRRGSRIRPQGGRGKLPHSQHDFVPADHAARTSSIAMWCWKRTPSSGSRSRVATHDPRYADDADSFDPERDRSNSHIGFGLGAHICLGQYIARAQIHEGLHLIAQRLRNPRSTGPLGYRPFPGTWGLRGLPLEFDLEPVPA